MSLAWASRYVRAIDHSVAGGEDVEEYKTHRAECLRGFLAQIPPALLCAARPYDDNSWRMYNLFARCPGALELAESNRALALGLGTLVNLRVARRLVRLRRREIARALGFPATRSAVRILARFEGVRTGPAALVELRAAMADPVALGRLQHLGAIREMAVDALLEASLAAHLSHGLLEDLCNASPVPEGSPDPLRVWQDCLRMWKQLGRGPRVVRSVAHLRRLHDDLVEERRRVERGELLVFAPPPLAGIPGEIEPLTDSWALADEGDTLHHCVGSLVDDVLARNLYVYRVLQPERCTVSIEWDELYDAWRVGEIAGFANTEVGAETMRAVTRWVRGAGSAGATPRRAESGDKHPRL